MKKFFWFCFCAMFGLVLFNASITKAEDVDKVKVAMEILKSKLTKIGPAKIEGTIVVEKHEEGKEKEKLTVPALYFGKTMINNYLDVVDEVKKAIKQKTGDGGTATVFVKHGEEYIRITTNVLQKNGARGVGTNLAHNAAYDAIKSEKAFYGKVDILGSSYETGYEPIKDSTGKIIGIYYVGFKIP